MNATIEEKLIEIWKDMFHIDDITSETDFFDIGGNSLNAMKFLSRADHVFGMEVLTPDILFEDGRIKALAAAINLHKS